MARDLVSSLTVAILLGHPQSEGAIVVFTSRHSMGCARSDNAEELGSDPRRASGTEVPETTGILHREAKATAMPGRIINGGRLLYQKS
jgi:hypothetical protein